MARYNLGTIVGIQGAQGAQGTQGVQGVQGLQGITPQIAIGTVETLAAGAEAYVRLAGNSTDAVPIFDIGIPKGADGNQGDMEKSVYDTENRAQDIFSLIDLINSDLNVNYEKYKPTEITGKINVNLSEETERYAIGTVRNVWVLTTGAPTDSLGAAGDVCIVMPI